MVMMMASVAQGLAVAPQVNGRPLSQSRYASRVGLHPSDVESSPWPCQQAHHGEVVRGTVHLGG